MHQQMLGIRSLANVFFFFFFFSILFLHFFVLFLFYFLFIFFFFFALIGTIIANKRLDTTKAQISTNLSPDSIKVFFETLYRSF